MKPSYAGLLLLCCLSGCGGVGQGEPLVDTSLMMPMAPRVQTPTTDGSSITQVYLPQACTDAVAKGAPAADAQATRNECIYALKSIIDDKFRGYRLGLHHLVNGGNTAADIAVLGLGLAGTITPGEAAKTLLAAIGTSVAAAKTTIDANYLYKQSIEMVINQMEADRNAQFTLMIAEMQTDMNAYGYNEAMDDLLKYYASGTWDHAITSLQTATAANANACQAAVVAAKTTKTQTNKTVSTIKTTAVSGGTNTTTTDSTTTGSGPVAAKGCNPTSTGATSP